MMETKPCTCHPDDNPPVPCAEKYAFSECTRSDSDELDRLNHLSRQELAAERAAKHDRIGRIQFKSAGATRKR